MDSTNIIHMLSIIIIIIIIIIGFLLVKRVMNPNNVEGFSTDEAIANLASVYNTDQLTIGNLTATGNLSVAGTFNLLPRGIIVMWSGSTSAIPTGWALCDGSANTPDLKGRFVLGFGAGDDINSVGGERSHQLTTNEMPAHAHEFCLPKGDKNWDSGGGNTLWGGGCDFRTSTSARGGNQAHNNMPPYYVLAYIMKL